MRPDTFFALVSRHFSEISVRTGRIAKLQIIGHGFVAHHLAGLADRHEHVAVIAAGVSRTTAT